MLDTLPVSSIRTSEILFIHSKEGGAMYDRKEWLPLLEEDIWES